MSAAKILNAFVAYEFIKLLATPFKKTKAFKLGIIDDEGKVLRKRRTLKDESERRAYTVFHTLVWNIKKLLAKIGIGRSTLGSFAAALFLIKEECERKKIDYKAVELAFINHLHNENIELLEENEDDEIIILPAGTYTLGLTMTLDDGDVVRAGDEVIALKPQGPMANILGVNLFTVTHIDTGKEVTLAYKDLNRK